MAKVKKKLFLVETLVQYKMLYVIETNEGDDCECAELIFESNKDDGDIEELDQKFIGEDIAESKQITQKRFEKLCKTSVNGRMGDKIIYREKERFDKFGVKLKENE